ncbi:MAG: hypothetical protein H0X66_11240 [Verrucomicrobia bacterium]|nr:hypothetical protein [Verrucomicrobiota bacterium]
MKTAIGATLLLLGTHLAFAEHNVLPYYQPTATVVYHQPIVYQAPVVYTAPVIYNAPVSYQVVNPVVTPVYPVVNLAVNPVYQAADPAYTGVVYAPTCPTPNVIIAGRGAYYSSWDSSPTVIHIGRGHATRGSLSRRFR